MAQRRGSPQSPGVAAGLYLPGRKRRAMVLASRDSPANAEHYHELNAKDFPRGHSGRRRLGTGDPDSLSARCLAASQR